ncbi:hypothetical protein BKA67DRAFT_570496 [Truncatella angustata]|uniref:Uncharacterized protein n=1 Tax=Truncatella angustata TaxID=152316 RepID=A0A9P8ZY21_9PEZI|nr:uncharacterized protein BKA67DRAFT_570496 [Truncatella angustata]KAH6653598.1 hypothetical protein BKA67DRAFT_570496 [Truncatella angustata]
MTKDSKIVVAAPSNPTSRLLRLIRETKALSSQSRSQRPSENTSADGTTSVTSDHLSSTTGIHANDAFSTTDSPDR